ncbi:DEAD/DEAH box helicase, partial [Candidatus Nomurabacteria bacterium]|nr:DEAD/DEAH box helicase [Candidatus Nomurabacteria bacterium]
MEFTKLNIIPEILQALKEEEYTHPTDIQSQAIPYILNGHDILG